MRIRLAAAAGLAIACSVQGAIAQTAPLEQVAVPSAVDSGPVTAASGRGGTAFAATVRVPDAPWVRLRFAEVRLGVNERGGRSRLRITSLADGAVQHHTAETLRQWDLTSAYFNGDAVKVEIVAAAGAGPSRFRLEEILSGIPAGGSAASICDFTDDRVPSADPRVARTSPGGCTAWMISDFNHCLLTAGHCSGPGLQVVHFNVPESEPDGSLNFPGPEDQYTVDPASVQVEDGSVGRDWTYFGVFPNTETGLTPFEVQAAAFDLALAPPDPAGQTVRVTGHGSDSTPQSWNQVQQTDAGPYLERTALALKYRADTTSGNSGSPIVDETTGQAIGIHVAGGCSGSPDSGNLGTAADNAFLRQALAAPRGVCVPVLPLAFTFPDGLPPTLDPAGAAISVLVTGQNGGVPAPGTGVLHVDDGTRVQSLPMSETAASQYEAVFPATACGDTIRYWFTAATEDGVVVREPLLAPSEVYEALAAESVTLAFDDDFEDDLGWVVAGSLVDGAWERSQPLASGCARGAPESDADGSGTCFLTDDDPATCDSDVDLGLTVLVSPPLDTTVSTPVLTYWRWLDNTGQGTGSNPFQDVMQVEFSDDDGFNWTPVEVVGPLGLQVQGGWHRRSWRVADFVAPSTQFRVRFVVSDVGGASLVEAGVDGVQLLSLDCDADPCPWDCGDGSGVVEVVDFLALLAQWGSVGSPCDTGLGAPGVGVEEFLDMLANWGGCP